MNILQRSLVQISRTVSRTNTVASLSFQSRFLSSNDSSTSPDAPMFNMENPFVKERKECVLCAHNIEVDYKNVRLLSQFVSPYTGRLYDKHITGLCEAQHRAVKKEVSRAVRFGLMSPFYRDPQYANDPRLFDPSKPSRPNPY